MITMRGAQIDPTLCRAHDAVAVRAAAPPAVRAGVGLVFRRRRRGRRRRGDEGRGFLPLLVLLPIRLHARRAASMGCRASGRRSLGLVAVGFLLGAAVWLVPMLVAVATRHDPSLVAYRNEILFQQTVHRYAAAWHHVEPWYYFLVEVIPPLWLPLSLLLFWLVPRWKAALASVMRASGCPSPGSADSRVLFAERGKRGIYIFPALPALIGRPRLIFPSYSDVVACII